MTHRLLALVLVLAGCGSAVPGTGMSGTGRAENPRTVLQIRSADGLLTHTVELDPDRGAT